MLARLFLLFTLVPLLELYVLIQFTRWTGNIFLTLAVVVGTGVLGAYLARQQGWRAWLEIQRQLAAGRMPAEAVQDGLLILLAGALLITPGLLSDVAGISLLLPRVRQLVRRYLAARWTVRIAGRSTTSAWSAGEKTFDTTFTDVDTAGSPRHRVIDVRVVEPGEQAPDRR